MLRFTGEDTRGRVSFGAGLLSRGVVKRAVPLLQNETQKMNTTEELSATECPAIAPKLANKIVKPIKFPSQPHEWKIVSLKECPTPENMQQCETPNRAAAYWKAHIATHPYFNSECECLVVFILNTGRRIKGHYLVSIGTMDTILCHSREIFRLAFMASAAAIIIAHNNPSGVIPHSILCRTRANHFENWHIEPSLCGLKRWVDCRRFRILDEGIKIHQLHRRALSLYSAAYLAQAKEQGYAKDRSTRRFTF